MVGAAMGTTALSYDDGWWAIPVKSGATSKFVVIDTRNGSSRVILERDTIGHPQFCPDDSELILYAGPLTDRVWVVTRDGSSNRRVYERRNDQEWVTHETWLPSRREIAFVTWPHGMRAVHVDDGSSREITRFRAWHAVAESSGRRIVCDTNFPDIGIAIFDSDDPALAPVTITETKSSSAGDHWAHPFPYNDGPVEVYAPQHTHPHPRFSPDGKRVTFTSDRSGHAQLYEWLDGHAQVDADS